MLDRFLKIVEAIIILEQTAQSLPPLPASSVPNDGLAKPASSPPSHEKLKEMLSKFETEMEEAMSEIPTIDL